MKRLTAKDFDDLDMACRREDINGMQVVTLVRRHYEALEAECSAPEPREQYNGEQHDLVCTVLGLLESDRDVDRAIEILRAARKDHERRFAAQGSAVEPCANYDVLAGFADWLCREMPANTVISDPRWWAPRLLRAVEVFQKSRGPELDANGFPLTKGAGA